MRLGPLPKLRTREVVPTSRIPNFRDHGRMVDGPLLALVARLQRKYGECFASEAGLRRMIAEDVGHMPGVLTLPPALERLRKHGILTHEWLRPGGLMPDGSPCSRGTRLIVLPKCRRERRTLASKNRRETVSGRPDPRALSTLAQARRTIAQRLAPTPVQSQDALERRRVADLARLAELEASWASGPPHEPDKPPE